MALNTYKKCRSLASVFMNDQCSFDFGSSSIFQEPSSEIKEAAPGEAACHAAVGEEEAQRPGDR